MTRPAADPLRALSPDALAADVAMRVLARARALYQATEGEVDRCPLATAVRRATGYAQSGAGRDDAPHDLHQIEWATAGARPADGLALMLDAARCRLAIDGGHAVTLEPLAALAGVSLRTVRAALASGALVATESSRWREREVTAMQARRWLASRGVPGYA